MQNNETQTMNRVISSIEYRYIKWETITYFRNVWFKKGVN